MSWVRGPSLKALAIGIGFSFCASITPVVGAQDTGAHDDALRVLELEQQSLELSQRLTEMHDAASALVPPGQIGADVVSTDTYPVIELAQSSRDVASINVRLGQMEEQMRVLNGQVDGLQFQLAQMQTFLERLQQDYEFRFEQLEGSRSGKTEAAPQSGSVTLPGGAPQTPIVTPPLTGALDLDASDEADSDRLVSSGSGDSFGARDVEMGLGTIENELSTFEGRNLSLDGPSFDLDTTDADIVTDDDADAQYRAAFDAVARGDFDFAEEQFRQFVELFPNHTQAPEAVNWLGEALLQRGAYDEAAEVFFDGFDAYSRSARAPNLLMNLAIALSGAGEDDTACRTFGEVQKRFLDQPNSFKTKLATEMRKAKC